MKIQLMKMILVAEAEVNLKTLKGNITLMIQLLVSLLLKRIHPTVKLLLLKETAIKSKFKKQLFLFFTV